MQKYNNRIEVQYIQKEQHTKINTNYLQLRVIS